MIADFMQKGFLENMIDMFKHDTSLYSITGDLLRDERRKLVEEHINRFLVHLSRGDGLASLNVEEDAAVGNVEVLLIHEERVERDREGSHRLMKAVFSSGGKVYIVKGDYGGEGIVRKLGGAIGIRRYPLRS